MNYKPFLQLIFIHYSKNFIIYLLPLMAVLNNYHVILFLSIIHKNKIIR